MDHKLCDQHQRMEYADLLLPKFAGTDTNSPAPSLEEQRLLHPDARAKCVENNSPLMACRIALHALRQNRCLQCLPRQFLNFGFEQLDRLRAHGNFGRTKLPSGNSGDPRTFGLENTY